MEVLLTVKQMGSYLNMSTRTARRILERRELPFIQNPLRVYRTDLESWLSDRRVEMSLSRRLLRKVMTTPLKYPIGGGIGDMTKVKSKGRLNFGGSVYIRKCGKHWTIDFYTQNGERVQRVIKDARNREEALEALRVAVIKEFGIEDGQRKAISFKEFSEVYISDYALIEKKSWKTDEYRMNVLKAFFKNTDLRYINAPMIRKFRAERLRKGNTEATCNRYMALLKRMFNLASEDNYCETNPVKQIKFFSEAIVKKERVLSEEEEVKLLE